MYFIFFSLPPFLIFHSVLLPKVPKCFHFLGTHNMKQFSLLYPQFFHSLFPYLALVFLAKIQNFHFSTYFSFPFTFSSCHGLFFQLCVFFINTFFIFVCN
uniref:Uncharacterized protein n=1 Tax=Cacopsylla melanoneura TaxID=428564 RepID=A0A8D8LDJ3_9HEMI